MQRFTKSFTQQEALPEESIARAVAVMRSGRLHRYNTDPEQSETAQLECDFARYLGVPYCLAAASGGYCLHIALRACGLTPGAPVLCNAFTLAPVPGAIHNAGGVPVLVEIDADYRIDLDDLDRKAARSGAALLLLSHMRGHICDMDAALEICARHGLTLIEDCAHTMGGAWRGRKSGTFGHAACFSAQTYKHLNAGEGGLLTTADAETMARAVLHSGSYMLYGHHLAAPPETVFENVRLDTPNYSGRMDNLRAAILRPQLARLDENVARWNRRYAVLADRLDKIPGLRLPHRPAAEAYVGSSIQFSITDRPPDAIAELVARCAARGVDLKWFGDPMPKAFTSRYDSWRYLAPSPPLPNTLEVLSRLVDMRIPLTFDLDDCALIADIIAAEMTPPPTARA